MSVAFLYPGQGAQIPGMLHQLPNRAEATWTLQEASQVLGYDVLTLDTEQALSSTVSVQLAIFVSGVAATRIIQAEGVKPDVVAGLSVGAFAAAFAAGALAFKDGLSLVKLRAELMEKAYPKGYGLAAVIGFSETHLSQIVSEINKPESPVFVGNLNAPTQFVIAGSDSGMEAVLNRAKNEGARTAKRLPVSVPSHCALLKSVADELSRVSPGSRSKHPTQSMLATGVLGRCAIPMEFERIWQPTSPTRFVGTTRRPLLTSEASVFL